MLCKNAIPRIKQWNQYSFEVKLIGSLSLQDININGLFILAKRNESNDGWIPIYIDVLYERDSISSFYKILNLAKKESVTHVHISRNLNNADVWKLRDELIEKYKPIINGYKKENDIGNIMSDEDSISGELKDTSVKLDLLYKYESHYLELIKNYKEEIKFANTLQEDLRRERAQFFTQTLKDVIQTMKSSEIAPDVSANWVKDLVDSYTKSIDLSGDLAKTHVIEILSLLNNEAKTQASKANLDKLDNE